MIIFRIFLSLAVFAFCAGPGLAGQALAQEESVPAADEFFTEVEEPHSDVDTNYADDGHGKEKSSGGLPQLDPSTYPSQLFWLITTFAILYLVLSRKVLPDLSNVLETRLSHIQNDLDESEKLKNEAESVHDSYESILQEARKKTSALFVDIEADIQNKTQKQYQAFQERMDKETKLTEARLDKVKQEAKTDINSDAAEIATLAAQKIIGVSADINQAKDVIKDLNNKAKAA